MDILIDIKQIIEFLNKRNKIKLIMIDRINLY